jgi:hypothetical protein
MRRSPALVVACLLALVSGSAAVAAPLPGVPGGLAEPPAVAPVLACGDVPGLDLAGVTLRSATVVSAGAPAPYCEVRGTIAPANTIVLRLPVDGWTQRYVQTGRGGLCGSANINYGQAAGCPPVADGTVAGATTDMGHQGQNDGSWAAGNPQAQIDFAYRGMHVTAQVARRSSRPSTAARQPVPTSPVAPTCATWPGPTHPARTPGSPT